MVYQDLPPVRHVMETAAIEYEAQLGTIDYIVHKGDTLFGIAQKFNSTIEIILKFNKIENIRLIYSGQRLVIPQSPPESIIYTVKAGDTLYKIAKKYKASINNLIEFNYLGKSTLIKPGQRLVVTPSLK